MPDDLLFYPNLQEKSTFGKNSVCSAIRKQEAMDIEDKHCFKSINYIIHFILTSIS